MNPKNNIQLSGFTMVRNAGLLNYPFLESVRSVLPICDEFIINCGDSTDNTSELCELLKKEHPGKIQVFHSKWEKHNQTGGYQLKHQTDLAISHCKGNWCFCIQADEAVHEDDLPLIQSAMQQANPIQEVDGLLFDYVHFYGSYEFKIRGRNWYRREVRVFKNNRNIKAFRDAQGFRKTSNRLLVIPSHARVFHYGYVRTPQSLQTKSQEMAKWWGKAEEQAIPELRYHIGLKKFQGTHPNVMAERLREFPFKFEPHKHKRVWNKDEIKNAITLLWESVFPWRIGEFKNYNLYQG